MLMRTCKRITHGGVPVVEHGYGHADDEVERLGGVLGLGRRGEVLLLLSLSCFVFKPNRYGMFDQHTWLS